MATYPSLVMAQQLAEVIKARLGLAAVIGQDANGDPTVAFGPGTTTTASAFVRIKPRQTSAYFDVVGHVQPQYGRPHVAQILFEGTATSLGVLTVAQPLLVTLVAELARTGVRSELYVGPSGATGLATLANLNTEVAAGNLDASWEDFYNPLTNTM